MTISICFLNDFINTNHHDISNINQEYCALLRELTICPTPTDEQFAKTIDIMELNKNKIFIAIDETTNTIIATTSVLIEQKIIHGMQCVCHIEDVVTKQEYRGKGIAKQLLEKCVEYAKQNNCYKVILDCKDENVAIYEKCGFAKTGNQMANYL
jgi:glucosamine-phosphate N-acetyltransferase